MNKVIAFTLIELMIVVSLIGILAAIAIPSYQIYTLKAHVADPLLYANNLRKPITDYYAHSLEFPKNNHQARLPEPDKLISNKIKKVEVIDGAIHILLGNKIPKPLQGKYLTFRPAVVDGSPTSPISWLCGYAEPVDGMKAVGTNKTNVDQKYLPGECVK